MEQVEKTALVTGAGKGIGKAIALAFAQAGYNVIINYNGSKEAAQSVLKEAESYGVKAITIQADVSKDEQVKAMIDQAMEQFGRIDVLVNNSGINKDGLMMRMSLEDFHKVIAVNLEPADPESAAGSENQVWALTEGRRATVSNARTLCDMGADMILLTGNPGIGVQNRAITESLKAISQELGDRIILAAGKMHASGILSESGENLITQQDIHEFVNAGADIILLPAPATVPGITMEYIRSLVRYAHSLGALTLTAIGTSQEGADQETIRQIALLCKMTGTDIHHIGDSGYIGMALPENIMAYSIAIKGVRHTYRRMVRSVNR